MIDAEEFVKLVVKHERNGLLPEEFKRCNEFIAVHLAAAGISERAAKQGTVKEADATNALSRAWRWAAEEARKIWGCIRRFFKAIARCLIGAWIRLLTHGKDKAQEVTTGDAMSAA